MKRFVRLKLIILAALTVTAIPAAAAQVFMNVDGVRGPLTREGEPGWFRVISFQWVSARTPLPVNRPPRPGAGSFTFTKAFDSATDDLLLVGEAPIPTVKMHHLLSGSRSNRIEYVMMNVRVTHAPDPDNAGPETWSMRYDSITSTRHAPAGEKNRHDQME